MGIYFSVNGGGKKAELSMKSMLYSALEITTGENIIKNNHPFQMVSILDGEGTMNGDEVKKGDHFIVCSDQKEVIYDGTMTVMICTL